MALNRLTASICGTNYTLVSEDSLSYMRELTAKVDEEMTAILENDRRMSTTMAAVLTAVQNADVAYKESREAKELRLRLKKLVDEQETLRDRLAAANDEVKRLQKENLDLRTALEAGRRAPVKPARPMPAFEEILDDSEEP